MIRLARSLARHALGIGMAVGLIVAPPLALARPSGPVAAHEGRATPPVALAAIWSDGWGLPYTHGVNGMSMAQVDEGLYAVSLHDSRTPTVVVGMGEFVEFAAFEIPRLSLLPMPVGGPTAAFYAVAGRLYGQDGWSAAVWGLVADVTVPSPFRSGPVAVTVLAPMGIAPSERQAESDAISFAQSGTGDFGTPEWVETSSEGASAACSRECIKEFEEDDRDAEDMRDERDREDAVDTIGDIALQCSALGVICLHAWVFCVTGCVAIHGLGFAFGLDASAAQYARDRDAAAEEFRDCLEDCGWVFAKR